MNFLDKATEKIIHTILTAVEKRNLYAAKAYINAAKQHKFIKDDPDFINQTTLDNTGNTALHIAVQNSHKKVAELLRKNGTDSRKLNHLYASSKKSVEYEEISTFFRKMVKLLVQNGADPERLNTSWCTPLGEAVKHEDTTVFYNMLNNPNYTPTANIVYAIIDAVRVSESDSKFKEVEALIKKAKEHSIFNKYPRLLDTITPHGKSAIDLAYANQNFAIAKLLLNAFNTTDENPENIEKSPSEAEYYIVPNIVPVPVTFDTRQTITRSHYPETRALPQDEHESPMQDCIGIYPPLWGTYEFPAQSSPERCLPLTQDEKDSSQVTAPSLYPTLNPTDIGNNTTQTPARSETLTLNTPSTYQQPQLPLPIFGPLETKRQALVNTNNAPKIDQQPRLSLLWMPEPHQQAPISTHSTPRIYQQPQSLLPNFWSTKPQQKDSINNEIAEGQQDAIPAKELAADLELLAIAEERSESQRLENLHNAQQKREREESVGEKKPRVACKG